MIRVGFIGVPGSGKTSTARGLAAFYRRTSRLEKIELIAEYARRYITKYGSIDTINDQYRIMQKQIEWEDTVPPETDIIITDSPVHLGFLYATELRNPENIKDTMYYNDIFKRMNKINCPQRYDIIFHLPPVLKPVKDGIRAEIQFDDTWRKESDMKLQFIFKLFPPKNFITINAVDINERITTCMNNIISIL